MQSLKQRARAGFTLAELMVVIVIIGLLATLVVPNVVRKLFVANIAKAKADIVAICGAIDNYAIENGGKYPDSLDALIQPDANGHAYLELESVPLDPWKNPYIYEPAPQGTSKYRVISYGKDGTPGGEGDDADIDQYKIRNHEI